MLTTADLIAPSVKFQILYNREPCHHSCCLLEHTGVGVGGSACFYTSRLRQCF